ncbi:hypothetical protein E2C01_020980 [Portunus trituberculatus]|uniref:Uncharacterized protein n=1 Tax=Portunus trituberculatus TaxID=210409 RepID=A0A5B7E3R6_PORTR|nr:hypothetical protein [Portunus trituberculatus]
MTDTLGNRSIQRAIHKGWLKCVHEQHMMPTKSLFCTVSTMYRAKGASLFILV